MRWILIPCALAALSAPALAKPPTDDDAAKVVAELHDAVAAADTDAVLAQLQAPLRYEGLGLHLDGCDQFGERGTVSAKKLRAFAQCLVTYGGLFEHRLVGRVDKPGAKPADLDGDAGLQIWIARTGKHGVVRMVWTEGDELGASSSGVVGGVVTAAAPPPPPPPPPPPRDRPMTVAPAALRAQRIAGSDDLPPDDATKAAIAKDGKTRVIAVTKLCFDKLGLVNSVAVIKSSGYPTWDDELRGGTQAWKIKPFMVNGAAVPVCTAITFIYQHN